jgi:hypothetical protein
MHGSTGVEEMRAVAGMGRGRKKKEAKGILVYTKVLYAVVVLQLGPKLYHT